MKRPTPVPIYAIATLAAVLLSACNKTSPTSPSGTTSGGQTSTPSTPRPIQVVLFTHIEDNTPGGTIPSGASRTQYMNLRSRLVDMGELTKRYGVKWSLEPDWKYLLAALEYEDAATMATTGGVNVFRHLRDSLGAAIDPHSHESGGYNYTDVVYLLSQLGVGGSTVIGGHIWDPSLPQFQDWDRFRVPVSGQRYPSASWRGDILMGSGTPNHVNDPTVSGVWRPKNRTSYFEDDPTGNIACVGAWRGDLAGITELRALYSAGTVASTCLLTSSFHVNPSSLTAAGGISAVESTVVGPLASMKAAGEVVTTDFTTLISTWRSAGAQACTYRQ